MCAVFRGNLIYFVYFAGKYNFPKIWGCKKFITNQKNEIPIIFCRLETLAVRAITSFKMSTTRLNLLLLRRAESKIAIYNVTATLLSKTKIVYTVVTENMLEKEAIANFKQFHAEQRPEVDLTNAQISCVLVP